MMFIGGIGVLELGILGIAAICALVFARRTAQRWWALGLVACVAVAIINTPADPLSTFVVAAQCCGLYVLSAYAWHGSAKTTRPARE